MNTAVFAYVPRYVLPSYHPVLCATKSVPRHLCLDNSPVPSLRYQEPFIPTRRTAAGRGTLTIPGRGVSAVVTSQRLTGELTA